MQQGAANMADGFDGICFRPQYLSIISQKVVSLTGSILNQKIICASLTICRASPVTSGGNRLIFWCPGMMWTLTSGVPCWATAPEESIRKRNRSLPRFSCRAPRTWSAQFLRTCLNPAWLPASKQLPSLGIQGSHFFAGPLARLPQTPRLR